MPTSQYFEAFLVEADDYALNEDESSRFRVLLVSRVIVGNPYTRRFNATDLTEPPCGHHSVCTIFSHSANELVKLVDSLSVNLEEILIMRKLLSMITTPFALHFSSFMEISLRSNTG